MAAKATTQKTKEAKNHVRGPEELFDSWPPELLTEYFQMSQHDRRKTVASTTDTATLTGMSVSTVRNWCDWRRLCYVRIGHRRLIDVRCLKKYRLQP